MTNGYKEYKNDYMVIGKQTLTEDCGNYDDACDAEPREEPEHRKHSVGGGKSAGHTEHHRRHIGHQKQNPPAKPTE